MSEPVVIEVEAVVEPELAVERKGGDERRRGEPLLAEHACDGARVVRQPIAGVVADPMLERIGPGEDAGV